MARDPLHASATAHVTREERRWIDYAVHDGGYDSVSSFVRTAVAEKIERDGVKARAATAAKILALKSSVPDLFTP